MQAATNPLNEVIGFGPFRLAIAQRNLLEGDRPVRLGSRALEILITLVENAGEVVSHEVLVARTWPSTVVEDTSLRVHVAALRKALGDGQGGRRFITNVPGRGYCFVASVERLRPLQLVGSAAPVAAKRHSNLPTLMGTVVGREPVLGALTEMIGRHRLVTVLGPGGMGKTTVAITVAQGLAPSYPDGVAFVDLAPVNDSRLVADALASAVGLPLSNEDTARRLAESLEARRMLVVFDNCEHLIEAAAHLAETLLSTARRVKIIATSREKLDIAGEWTYQLPPLAFPATGAVQNLAEAMAFPAVDLLVQRASAASNAMTFGDGNAVALSELCRRLDGIPLAIEFAAARLGSLGLNGLLEHMDGRLELLSRGRRTALPRHHTLRAVIDWSFALLSEPEQKVLRRLSVFRSNFDLESGAVVAADPELARHQVVEVMSQLVEKSLVSARVVDESVDYRLLETTRAYAAEKLKKAKEAPRTNALHAQHMIDVLKRAEAEWPLMDREAWTSRYGPGINDIRAALDWCFSSRGSASTGVRLVAAALLVVLQLGPLDEYHGRVEQALDHLHELRPADPAVELRLNTALLFPAGRNEQALRPFVAIRERSLQLAAQLGEPKHHIAALLGAWVYEIRSAEFNAALSTAKRVNEHARHADPHAALLAQRIMAQTRHFLGDHTNAQLLAEQMLAQPEQNIPAEYMHPVPTAVAMRIVLARILWLKGCADRAREVAADCVELASDHPFALTQALALAACPVAIWRGDIVEARAMVQRLTRHAALLGSAYWQSFARLYDAAIGLVETEDAEGAEGGVRPLSLSIANAENQMALEHAETLVQVMPAASTVARATVGAVGWCAAEILRLHGESLHVVGAPNDEVGAKLSQAMAVAVAQGELAWELRCARSLAKHWKRQGRAQRGVELLSATLGRFTEGLRTRDLAAAQRELEWLS